ncbi:MarR family winged helix-turn-helix transcriptional regulator [Streptomyces heilongjiangensis]|uniref:MarR family winged helix-turn-helix transcriptional regulator n=1 Tax=Streptomyces heilongjiangensis TaxID=945052 RepID=A0ABW1AZU6_9ACTN|nr:MarR family transcriptional regulator [Streptomyces heilongjiangensis]MDC2946473.1 MarR family transcriptional regulator [Streptomyces heilongjiangensis]
MADHDKNPAHLPGCPSARGNDGLLPTELHAWMLLLGATGAVEQRLRAVVKERLGVSHDEFLVLCLLATSEDGLRMTRIAELLGRPKTRLTYQIACLQHSDLITRASVRGDKRGIQIALTDKARRLLADASDGLAGTITDALGEFMGPAQREALRGLLPDLVAERPAAAPAEAPDPASE